MKRTYVKPEIMFESFAACTNIAKCDIKNTLGGFAKDHCPYRVEFGRDVYDIFTSSMVKICTTTEYNNNNANDGEFNEICYDVPGDFPGLFGS